MIPEHRLQQLRQVAETVVDARSREAYREAEQALVMYQGLFGPAMAVELLNMIDELRGARTPDNRSTDVIVNLHEENDRLRRCLETYANERFWDTDAANKDKGEAARTILKAA